jgi:ABC-type transporter Mla MlaB component
MPGTYPFFELEIRKKQEIFVIRARGALTTDSARAIEEAIVTLSLQRNRQMLSIDLGSVFRFKYSAAARLARIIRDQARLSQSVEIRGAEDNIISVFKAFGVR